MGEKFYKDLTKEELIEELVSTTIDHMDYDDLFYILHDALTIGITPYSKYGDEELIECYKELVEDIE